jgi:hypothetical protein
MEKNEMKFEIQLNYPDWLYITRTKREDEEKEKGKTTTIKTSGCGLCSAVIVADRLLPNCEFSLKDAIRLSYDNHANEALGTTYSRFAPAFAKELGLRYERSADIEDLKRCLRTGGAVVINVGGDRPGRVGVFSHVGHYIVAINEEPDGRIAILDPAYQEGRYEEEGRVGKVEVKHGGIALTSPEILAEDSETRAPAYHLFWRA